MLPPEASEWLAILPNFQNENGGFPYFQGKESSLEPTSLAILALDSHGAPGIAFDVHRARQYLASRQSEPGHWLIAPEDKAPAWETPLVLLALAGDSNYLSMCRAGINAYLGVEADAANPAGVTLNPRWRGWNWYPPTPGWVEPTSLALMTAQRLRALADKELLSRRLEDGRQFLLDRMSPDGGWNYGNSYILGSAISPFLAPTAMALLALESISASDERIPKALLFLENNVGTRPSGLTLSWGILALLAFERPVDHLREALLAAGKQTLFLGNLAVISLALLAMESTFEKHPFRMGTTQS